MEAGRNGKILLVVPPFWGAGLPNLAVSQLKANLEHAGHSTEVLYLNYLFARRIGVPADEWLNRFTRTTILGEYVFSAALYGQDPARVEDYMNEVMAGTEELRFLEAHYRDSPAAVLTRWREEAIRFCDGEGLEAILDRGARLVGFTSSFQQNCASLALLDRVKRARPEIVTVIGGANCEGEMGEELMTRFPAIDYLGQGECDHALVALADALAEGRTGQGIPGIRWRVEPATVIPSRPLLSKDLDELPYPDLDDYFAQRTANGLDVKVRPLMVMETARGCWWGAKHHCTFCGLNGEFMGFRSKSPPRALAEIDWQVDRHGPHLIRFSDNILDMKYFKTVLPKLAESRRTTLFFETKANLTRDQVRLIAQARINEIQPGIESLSDTSLRLMSKGVSKLQNIQLLRWCAEYGVAVTWNYLLGFPGEDDGELPGIAEEAEMLHHLEPPRVSGVLRVDRFSPYFNKPDEYGIGAIFPKKAYNHIYPFPAESVERLAYDFTSDPLVQKSTGPGITQVRAMVNRWQKFHERSFLYAIPRRKNLFVIDTRRCATRKIHRLTGLRRSVYEFCDRARTLADMTRDLDAYGSPESIEDAVRSLVRDRLLLASANRYLSLGIEPEQTLTVENDLEKSTSGQDSLPATAPVPDEGVGLRLSPRASIRRLESRLRQYRRSLRSRWTRRSVLALARLVRERPEPAQRRDPIATGTDA